MKLKLILIFTLLISSCGSTKNTTNLPELTIENKSMNRLIVDRKPNYGIMGSDGCVVMQEISMDITKLDNGSIIQGKVFDSNTKVPLINATLKLTTKQKDANNTSTINTDKNGFYKSKLKGELTDIEIDYIGYRTLKVSFKKAF